MNTATTEWMITPTVWHSIMKLFLTVIVNSSKSITPGPLKILPHMENSGVWALNKPENILQFKRIYNVLNLDIDDS